MTSWVLILKVLGLAGWLLLGWQAAVWGHRLILDQQALPTVPSVVGPSSGPAPLPGLAMALGARTGESAGLRPEEVQVVGLLGAGSKGVLLASIRNGPVRAYAAGELSPDGWVFEGVMEGRLRLRRGAQTLELAPPALGKGLSPALPQR